MTYFLCQLRIGNMLIKNRNKIQFTENTERKYKQKTPAKKNRNKKQTKRNPQQRKIENILKKKKK